MEHGRCLVDTGRDFQILVLRMTVEQLFPIASNHNIYADLFWNLLEVFNMI